jgi:hypothetical protein
MNVVGTVPCRVLSDALGSEERAWNPGNAMGVWEMTDTAGELEHKK